MKKPDSFPYEHKAGGMVFQIYSAPLFKTAKSGERIRYESFLASHHEGGRRIQKRKPTWQDVETYIEDVVTAHRQSDPERLELTGRDRRIYLAALEAVKPLGRDVDDVARELVSAIGGLKKREVDRPTAEATVEELPDKRDVIDPRGQRERLFLLQIRLVLLEPPLARGRSRLGSLLWDDFDLDF
ncbi:MAG: hypothetical protein U1G07_23385 [Verrucomicrobiota bacterium]